MPIRSGAPLVEPVTVWPQRDVERCGGEGEGGGGAGGGGAGGAGVGGGGAGGGGAGGGGEGDIRSSHCFVTGL